MKRFQILFFVIGFVTLAPFLSHAANISYELLGEWEFENPSQGNLVLTFRPDRGFEIDLDADKKADIWGRYFLKGTEIRFMDEGGIVYDGCKKPGKYDVMLSDDKLAYALVEDSCQPRVEALTQSWIRVSNKITDIGLPIQSSQGEVDILRRGSGRD